MTWTAESPEIFKTSLWCENKDGEISYCNVYRSTLGGEDKASLLITISADHKEHWNNGILENSNYAKFHLTSDSKLQMISSGMNMPKFRKCKVKGTLHAAEKIVKYFQTV